MGQNAVDAQFGYCIDCRAGDHEACIKNSCRCRQTEEHNNALKATPSPSNDVAIPDDMPELPEDFIWEEPPTKAGRHPLTAEKQRMLKMRPGKHAHIKHYEGKSSAYQVVKNFNAGKLKDLDRSDWLLRDVKDGVHGPGSDLYAAYIGGE